MRAIYYTCGALYSRNIHNVRTSISAEQKRGKPTPDAPHIVAHVNVMICDVHQRVELIYYIHTVYVLFVAAIVYVLSVYTYGDSQNGVCTGAGARGIRVRSSAESVCVYIYMYI